MRTTILLIARKKEIPNGKMYYIYIMVIQVMEVYDYALKIS